MNVNLNFFGLGGTNKLFVFMGKNIDQPNENKKN